jgi:predicted HTH domain antitoxin
LLGRAVEQIGVKEIERKKILAEQNVKKRFGKDDLQGDLTKRPPTEAA